MMNETELKEFHEMIDAAIQKLQEGKASPEGFCYILNVFERGSIETIGSASSWKQLAAATWLLTDLWEEGGRDELIPIIYILTQICDSSRKHNDNHPLPTLTHPGTETRN